MNIDNENKKYVSVKISRPDPHKDEAQSTGADLKKPAPIPSTGDSLVDTANQIFYEIEYGICDIPGVGKFVPKSQKIERSEKDPIRERFTQMRSIKCSYPFAYNSNRFFDRTVQHIKAEEFYKQALFMKDFEDDYENITPMLQYYPCYQLMGYEQLRTYFTWRTKIRQGTVIEASLSYAFLYIYELLHNIGVQSPEEGLEKLISFWQNFRMYAASLDKYVLRWLKDYHIYYTLPHSFKEFIIKNELSAYYPEALGQENDFSLFSSLSKYDIKKSKFFTPDREELIIECFNFTIERLREVFLQNGMDFDDTVFRPEKKMPLWTPFKEALFFPWLRQEDKQIIISKSEIYICKDNVWSFSTVLTSDSGKAFVAYILKQMESTLRNTVGYKYKISADIDNVTHEAIFKLSECGVSLKKEIELAVSLFYKEKNKIVVNVDASKLSQIRKEALQTQEKLIVPENEEPPIFKGTEMPPKEADLPKIDIPDITNTLEVHESIWDKFKENLSDMEIKILRSVIYNGTALEEIARTFDVLPEILADGINEKAVDFIGDNILDGDFLIYPDYEEELKEMVKDI